MLTFSGKTAEEIRYCLHERHLFHALEARMHLPLVPLPDNFSKPTNMPWGGTKILDHYKNELPIRTEKRYPIVGESWEISADPLAPSEFVFELGEERISIDFIQLLELFPQQILGAKVAEKFDGQNPILVKLLDAADHLSVQVHPSDDYEGLKPNESGKPESWYILEAAPNCGLYLGLRESVSKEQLRQAIEAQEDVSRFLNFVEVHPGDFFVIDAGTIHSIGAGVTLIEPQKIAPKRSGKTYRLWDWHRRYDAQGNKDPRGASRELHIEDSFRVIDFGGLRGAAFIQHIRSQFPVIQQNGKSVERLCADTPNFGVSQVTLNDDHALPQSCVASFHGLIVYEGRVEVCQGENTLSVVSRGESVIIPAALATYHLKSRAAKAVKIYFPQQYL